MPGTPRAAAAEQGFTLLEILVGLAISSLILLGLSQSMKAINMGFDRATTTIGRQQTLATGLHIFAGDVSRIERATNDPAQPSRFLFRGDRFEMIYVMAERPGRNRLGLYWVRLFVRKIDDGYELVRVRAPFVSEAQDLAEVEWGDEVVLIRGDMAIEFSYRAPRAGLRDWASDWLAVNMLPGQVKIEIRDIGTGRLRMPVFVQTLKIGAEAPCVSAGAPGCTMGSDGQLVGSAATP